jgi:hypothetical protein
MLTPQTVTTRSGESRLIVMDRREGFPTTFALLATTAADKVVLRVSGGCKGMDANDKQQMLTYFSEALAGFRGMIWSGATRQVDKEGALDPMVTDVPGVIAATNPECVALGSAPRTDYLRLKGESSLVLDSYGTLPNPTMTGILVVQNGADGKSDWDGDLDAAFTLMSDLVSAAAFKRAGVIAWNGGLVTEDEVLRSAKQGWPTFVVRGSGRLADEISQKLESGNQELLSKLPKNHRLRIVERDNSFTLRSQLQEFGFLSI